MQTQAIGDRRENAVKGQAVFANCPITHAGEVFRMNVGGIDLSPGRFTIDLNEWVLPAGRRPASAELPGSVERALFAVGEVQIDEDGATLVLFGTPDFDTEYLVF